PPHRGFTAVQPLSERRGRMLLRKVHQHCVIRCGPRRPVLEILAYHTQLLGSLPNHMATPFGMQLLNLVDSFPCSRPAACVSLAGDRIEFRRPEYWVPSSLMAVLGQPLCVVTLFDVVT